MNDSVFRYPALGRPERSVLVCDRSSSMKEGDYKPSRLDGAKAAISVFVRRKPLIDRRDLTGVVAFNEGAELVAGIGEHPVQVENLLRPIAARGNTNITSGLELALNVLSEQPQMKIEPLRRCVLLSDGHHNNGPSPADSGILARAVRDGVIVDTVAIGDANDVLLQQIAKETGGMFMRCGNTEALLELYNRLAEKKPAGL